MSRFTGVAIDGVGIGEWFYWPLNTHHSELQAITEPPLISTLYKLLQAKSSPACSVFNQPFHGNGF
jgi:hypothetical protein